MPLRFELQTTATDDVAEVIRLSDAYIGQLYPDDHSHLVTIPEMFVDGFEFYLAWAGSEMVGSVALKLSGRHPELKRLFVRDEFRGRGFGTALVEFAIDRCRALRAQKLQLETGDELPVAIRAYERLGFKRTGPFGGYVDDGVSIFYELVL